MTEKFHDRLKKLRIHLGYSQYVMADALDVSINAYCNYERGERRPAVDFLLKLSTLEPSLNLNWLLKGERGMFNDEVELYVFRKRKEVLSNIKEWGQRLSKYMAYFELTPEKLSALTDIRTSRIEDFILKSSLPCIEEINKLKAATNIPVDILLYGNDNTQTEKSLSIEELELLKKIAKKFNVS